MCWCHSSIDTDDRCRSSWFSARAPRNRRNRHLHYKSSPADLRGRIGTNRNVRNDWSCSYRRRMHFLLTIGCADESNGNGEEAAEGDYGNIVHDLWWNLVRGFWSVSVIMSTDAVIFLLHSRILETQSQNVLEKNTNNSLLCCLHWKSTVNTYKCLL